MGDTDFLTIGRALRAALTRGDLAGAEALRPNYDAALWAALAEVKGRGMSEPEYFYTLDLGKVYGPKLERLAVKTCHGEDVEAFAALLLRGALDALEAELRADVARPPHDPGKMGDDEIPF